jgi:hypothetical protein
MLLGRFLIQNCGIPGDNFEERSSIFGEPKGPLDKSISRAHA